mgnify:CR=1 FL=1
MAKTSIEIQAEKNAQATLKESRLKQNIKEHNVRAALKNERKNREEHWSGYGLKSTEKSDSLNKELRKSKKSKKFINKTQDKLDRGDPTLLVKSEKIKLEKKLPSTEGSFKGGGIARRGLGRAFMKGGKV